jgi:hypothetical protein
MRRRELLGALGAGAVAAALGPRRASALDAPWGRFPDGLRDFELPTELRAESVLELFLVGGLSPWESFYAVPRDDYGRADKRLWWTFQEGPDALEGHFRACGGTGPMLTPFVEDALGAPVHLGPLAGALRARPDILNRLRLHVVSHGLFPHEPAKQLALTGSVSGNPRQAGVGAHVIRHERSLTGSAGGLPAACVFIGANAASDIAATAVGQHPRGCQPLGLVADDDLSTLSHATGSAAEQLRRLYEERVLSRGRCNGSTLRSRTLAALEQSGAAEAAARRLIERIGPSALVTAPGSVCGISHFGDPTRAMLASAARLLSARAMRHVTVVDGALRIEGSRDGYDFHNRYVVRAVAQVPRTFDALCDVINRPGEGNPAKLDLDRTMVVVNTEFGRSPELQGSDGRNHHPAAYVTLMFGGPIRAAQRGIVGAIDRHGQALDPMGAAESRAATLMALGIWPFEADAFSWDVVRGATSEREAAARLMRRTLGVTT